jgi:putative zinc finger/helix-turn-helix YgiT family protein
MKSKPFPWMCPHCRERTVSPLQRDYTMTAEHDGQSYEITLPNVPVPTCSRCGEVIVTSELAERVTAELRRTAGLLLPQTIQEQREALGLTRSQLAAALRIAEATLTRWETGMQLQSRALDLLLRLYFSSADVRKVCVPPVAGSQVNPIWSTQGG